MKEIKLEDFRCYANQSVTFRSGINLLVGDNASGKTSLLMACKYALSSFFAGFSDENTKWISPDADDFRQVVVDGILSQELPINIHFNLDEGEHSSTYTLTKNSKKNSRSLISGIKEYKDYAYELKMNFFNEVGQQKELPLFACFSTEDIHSTRKIDAGKFKTYTHKSSFGYYECLNGDGFFPYWTKRLLILKEGEKNIQEIEIVHRAIVDALGSDGCNIINDMNIRHIQGNVYYNFTDAREIESKYLSDGYRRIVNVVTDIAFRCALLNRGIFGNDACKKTKGTVLIDEVDLHLHPSLQSTILKGLRNAFPRLQFIVSSHAPMVMSGVETNDENIVYKLDYDQESGYSVNEVYTYGMDLSTISSVILDQTPRTAEVDFELNKLFEMIDDNDKDAAWNLLREMQGRFDNNLPELTEAETMLNFTIEEDEADSKE